MARTVSIGTQDFEKMIQRNCFYVDKTGFIKEWWESEDEVTLITRPRRFGKTLNMSMLNCFFSNKYADRGELFEKLEIWKDGKYREIQGTYPVIFLSFAGVKGNTFELSKKQIYDKIIELYESNRFLLKSDCMSDTEKARYISFLEKPLEEDVSFKLNELSNYLSRYYGKKVIILLDEYDTPMQEAYVNGYWEELVAFTRSLFNSTFKTNPYLERAIMTGITTAEYSAVRKFAKQTSNGSAKAETMSKESIFSDLNNLEVVTTLTPKYETAFGFTEEEVFKALDEQGLSDKKNDVKIWYDGFRFGSKNDIYNPWSIINCLDKKKIALYWAESSSNGLINSLVQKGSSNIKMMVEELINGSTINVPIDEQIVFSELDYSEDAVWSLMLASGYLKVVSSEELNLIRESDNEYELALTNREILFMFKKMILRWFSPAKNETNEFIKALISGDIESMNEYMNDVALRTFSSFDTGKHTSEKKAPENLASCYDCQGVANGSSLNYSSNLYAMTEQSSRFFHGFVLGLMVDQSENYIITSNRESGFGRYDIMLEPKDKQTQKYPGIVIEFKVINPRKENSLEETVEAALKQIEDRNYDTELINRGVNKENIHHYGFAFKSKEVLIDGN